MDTSNAMPYQKLEQYNKLASDEICYYRQPLLMEKVLPPHLMNPSSSNSNDQHTLPNRHGDDSNLMHHVRYVQQEKRYSQRPQRMAVTRHRFLAPEMHGEVKREEEFEEDEFEDEEQYYEEDHEECMDVDVDGEEEFDGDMLDSDHFISESNLSATRNNINSKFFNNHIEKTNENYPTTGPPIATSTPNTSIVRQSRAGISAAYAKQDPTFQKNLEVQKTPKKEVDHPTAQSTMTTNNSTTKTTTPKASRNNGINKNVSWLASQPKLNAKSKSGYILFSAEVRKRVMNENPDAGFGEVSRIVGVEWKRLSDENKRQYEKRAQFIAEERTKAELLTPNSKLPEPGQIRAYFCRWQHCDFQFDCLEGLYDHIRTSHTENAGEINNLHVCLWNSCVKYRKEGKPFPTLPRLHRHIKEKHLPSSMRLMFPNQRGKNYFVYLPPPSPQNGIHHSSKKNIIEHGKFVHHPHGEEAPNAVPCAIATPIEAMSYSGSSSAMSVASTSADQRAHQSIQNSALSTALGQQKSENAHTAATPHHPRHTAAGTFSTTPRTQTAGSHGATLMNGTVMQATQSGTNTCVQPSSQHHNYVVQQNRPQIAHQSHIQQQIVYIPPGQQAIIVNGVTIGIPPNAQTIILPPGYTGPQQQHQIVVHTQPPPQSQQQVHLVQSTSGQNITAANQAAHYKQSQQQQQQLVQQRNVQQYTASPGMTQNLHPQQQHLISNGIPVSTGVHATQYIAASSIPSSPAVTASSGHSGLPASYQQQQHIAAIAHQHPSTSTAIYQNHATTVTASAVPTLSNNVQTSSTATVQQQQLLIDPGRTIVTAPKAPEPLFVSPSNSVSVKRALHSEVYVRYIESLHAGVGMSKPQRTVSKWDKALEASHRNTVVPSQRKLPYEWIRHVTNGSKPKEDQIVRALWSLREHLVEGTTGIDRNQYRSNQSEAIAPNFHFDEPSKKNNGNVHKKGS